jgi:hypothetical protein
MRVKGSMRVMRYNERLLYCEKSGGWKRTEIIESIVRIVRLFIVNKGDKISSLLASKRFSGYYDL